MAPASIRVLLVEDNPLHARLLKGFLGRISGQDFPVLQVGSLEEALIRASRDSFDVVLLDLVLPDGSGLDTLLRFRARFEELPVVVLTGLDDVELATRALEHGAQDYLLKSQINGALLQRSLRYAVERGQVESPEWDAPALRAAHQHFMKAVQMVELDDRLRRTWLFPRRIQQVYLPRPNKAEAGPVVAFRVHHLGEGLFFGGVRQHGTVTRGEITALALRATWQSALFGLPFGGAFGGIRCDGTKWSEEDYLRLLESYLEELASPKGQLDLVGPGLGTATSLRRLRSTGKGTAVVRCLDAPEEATAQGLGALLDRLGPDQGVDLLRATAVIQGFGALGQAAARYLDHHGVRVLAVSEERGGIMAPEGLDIPALLQHVEEGQPLHRFGSGSALTNAELLQLPCDFLIPAAVGNQITVENAGNLNSKLIAEMACGAVTMEAEEILLDRGVLVIPDLLANAGGTIYAAQTWAARKAQAPLDHDETLQEVRRRIEAVLGRVQSCAADRDLDLRSAAMVEAILALKEVEWTR